MKTTIATRMEFASAHFLPKVPEGHKCARMHGHNYIVEVFVDGLLRPDGMVLDFGEVKAVLGPIVKGIDHHTLNNFEGLENPTAEIMAHWFLKKILDAHTIPDDVLRVGVRIYETPTAWAEVWSR